ncbi:hypothetical protein ACTJIJ_00770 [Niabella sp. 22666]|uniref:hypothetical protein n=1 Tax=Niabella sp. 22666 TaxID=3453954 RepID=UPI003F84D447
MKRLSLFVGLIIMSTSSFLNAQQLIPTHQNRNEYRKASIPSYGLEKVRQIVSQTPKREGYMNRPIPQSTYDPLSVKEKFTYAMMHPEAYLQNCSFYGDLHNGGKIFGRLSLGFNENTLSKRQLDFLQAYRDSVLFLINDSYQQHIPIGINFKQAISEVNGWEFIPVLIDCYNKDKKDADVLCLLMILMKKGAFNDFCSSTIYDQLYGKGRHPFYATIQHSPDNERFIIKAALKYFNHQKKANPARILYY